MPEAEEENGKVIEFPGEEIRMPTQLLPKDLGRVEDSHPLRKSISVLILILAIILTGVLIYSFAGGAFPGPNRNSDQAGIETQYRESGSITYNDEILSGWFLDTEREHFMDENGVRYTYVDPHEREGHRVSGHWRIME